MKFWMIGLVILNLITIFLMAMILMMLLGGPITFRIDEIYQPPGPVTCEHRYGEELAEGEVPCTLIKKRFN